MAPEDAARAGAEGARPIPALDQPAASEGSPVDAFRRQVDDLASKTDVITGRHPDEYYLDDYYKLTGINKQLEDLRKMVVQRCRKMTSDEKRILATGLFHLSQEDISEALHMVAQDNPSFQPTAEVVDLDMDALSQTTLWKLKFFVREALERAKADENARRKRDIYNALAKTASKRIKK